MLKDQITIDFIQKRNEEIIKLVDAKFSSMPNLITYCNNTDYKSRIPIYIFNVKCNGKMLHYNFVCKLLNDLFGIQSRGGCSCASLLTLKLLNINNITEYKSAIEEGIEIIKPGFVRLNFSFLLSNEEVEYILSSINFICENGWMFVPLYTYSSASLIWEHRTFNKKMENLLWLSSLDFSKSHIGITQSSYTHSGITLSDSPHSDLQSHIQFAVKYISEIKEEIRNIYGKASIKDMQTFNSKYKSLLWFTTIEEILDNIISPTPIVKTKVDIDTSELNEEMKTIASVEMHNSRQNPGIIRPPHNIAREMGRAIKEFNLIEEGDKIMIAVSGGKDSLSLLHIMKYFQSKAPIHFTFIAATVDPKAHEFNPEPLIDYMKQIGVEYYMISDNLIDRAKECMQNNSLCSFCSRMKRGMLYNCAREQKCNKIAIAHHLDDLAESFIMSSFHNGLLRTMKAKYTITSGDIVVIRPLVYVREKWLNEYAQKNTLPVITDNCPACFAAPKERHRTKLLLAQQESIIPSLFSSLSKTMLPLMKGNIGDKEAEEEF